MPGAWPVWTPGVQLATLLKESIIHLSTQHMKALGHMVSEKNIFYVFPIVSLWELSVAMENRALIRPGPKHITFFPPPQ